MHTPTPTTTIQTQHPREYVATYMRNDPELVRRVLVDALMDCVDALTRNTHTDTATLSTNGKLTFATHYAHGTGLTINLAYVGKRGWLVRVDHREKAIGAAIKRLPMDALREILEDIVSF